MLLFYLLEFKLISSKLQYWNYSGILLSALPFNSRQLRKSQLSLHLLHLTLSSMRTQTDIPGESHPVYPGQLFCLQEALSQIRVNHLALVNKSGVLPLMRYLHENESYLGLASFPGSQQTWQASHKPRLMLRPYVRRHFSSHMALVQASYRSYPLSPAVWCNLVRAEQLSKRENDKCSPKVGMVLNHTGVVPNNHGDTKLSQVSGDC